MYRIFYQNAENTQILCKSKQKVLNFLKIMLDISTFLLYNTRVAKDSRCRTT